MGRTPTIDEILSRWLPHYTHRQFAEEVRALGTHGEKWLYRFGQPTELWQGDILPDLPLLSVGSNEEVSVAVSWGMIVSNTCDLVIGQDEFAVIVPIISFAEHLQANPMAEKTLTSFHHALRESIIPIAPPTRAEPSWEYPLPLRGECHSRTVSCRSTSST